jgi:hypothetical protein
MIDIEKLEDHRKYQIEENRKISRRVDEYGLIICELQGQVNDLRWRMNEVCNKLHLEEKL